MGGNKLNICSANGDAFAHYSSTGVLKVWNTDTGALDHSFTPADHLASSVTCLSFNLKNEREPQKSKSPNRKSTNEIKEIQFLALGTVNGKILIYCTTEQKFHSTLTHSSSAINDLTWSSDKDLLSLSKDKVVVFWNVLKSSKLGVFDVSANNTICYLGSNPDVFVVADIDIQILKLKGGKKEKQITDQHSFNSGQVIPISILLPVKIKNQPSKYFLTASKNSKHRHVYAWSTENKSGKFVAAFKVQKSVVEAMSCVVEGSSSLILAVVTSKGDLQIFKHHLNGKITIPSEIRPISSVGKLSVMSSIDETVRLPIITCQFLSDSTLVFAYGPEFFPSWEKISVDDIKEKTQLVRSDSRQTKKSKSNLVKTVTPLVPDDAATVVTNSCLDYREVDIDQISAKDLKKSIKRERSATQSISLEKCLDALSMKQPSTALSRAPLADGIHLLMQGLRSKDNEMIQSILAKGENDDILNNTVKRLPVEFLESFFHYLQDLMSKGGKSFYCLKWIKSLLYHHMSHLSNVSSREMLMSPITHWTAARMTIFPKVTKLHSRLNLLLTHVSARHENSTRIADEPDALLAYKDESDVESEIDFGSDHRLPSESEDFWDDLLSSGEDEDETMVNGETPKQSKAVKRKSSKLETDSSGDHEEVEEEEEEEEEEMEVSEEESELDDDDFEENCDVASEESDEEVVVQVKASKGSKLNNSFEKKKGKLNRSKTAR